MTIRPEVDVKKEMFEADGILSLQPEVFEGSDVDVEGLVTSWVEAVPAPLSVRSACLSDGSATYALFLSEAADFLDKPALKALAVHHILRGFDLLDQQSLSISLFGSLPGYAWVLSYLARSNSIPGAEQFLSETDEILLEAVSSAPDSMKIDVINGGAGLMVYAMERAESGHGRALLDALTAWYLRRFGYWIHSPSLEFMDDSPDANLGVAHGITGVLSAFSLAAGRGLINQEARNLTKFGLAYLDRFVVETRNGLAYVPSFQRNVEPSRLAWCYGNLGVAFTFLHAFSLSDNAASRLNQIVKYSIDQFESTSACLFDAPLCHGLSGTAMLFHLLATDERVDKELRASCASLSKLSVAKAFDHSFSQDGVRKFPLLRNGEHICRLSLLEGSLGVCLAMMATMSTRRPRWADILLV